MRLATFATEADVDEALRLFQVSTLDAAMTGSLAGCVINIYTQLVSVLCCLSLSVTAGTVCHVLNYENWWSHLDNSYIRNKMFMPMSIMRVLD